MQVGGPRLRFVNTEHVLHVLRTNPVLAALPAPLQMRLCRTARLATLKPGDSIEDIATLDDAADSITPRGKHRKAVMRPKRSGDDPARAIGPRASTLHIVLRGVLEVYIESSLPMVMNRRMLATTRVLQGELCAGRLTCGDSFGGEQLCAQPSPETARDAGELHPPVQGTRAFSSFFGRCESEALVLCISQRSYDEAAAACELARTAEASNAPRDRDPTVFLTEFEDVASPARPPLPVGPTELAAQASPIARGPQPQQPTDLTLGSLGLSEGGLARRANAIAFGAFFTDMDSTFCAPVDSEPGAEPPLTAPLPLRFRLTLPPVPRAVEAATESAEPIPRESPRPAKIAQPPRSKPIALLSKRPSRVHEPAVSFVNLNRHEGRRRNRKWPWASSLTPAPPPKGRSQSPEDELEEREAETSGQELPQ